MIHRLMTALAVSAIFAIAAPIAASAQNAAPAQAEEPDAGEKLVWKARLDAENKARELAKAEADAKRQAARKLAARKAAKEAAEKAEAERLAAAEEKLRKRYWWLPKSAIAAKLAEQENLKTEPKKQVAAKPAAKETARPAATRSEADARQEKPVRVASIERKPARFMFGMFDAPKPEPVSLTEEQAVHDAALASVPEKKKFKVKDEFAPQSVAFSGYKPGTIVIDTKSKLLYFVDSPVSAIRYGVAVGKEGLLFTGKATVGAKQPWPKWIPTKEMIARDPGKYGRYADGMEGGPKNPLGARAIYLYQGKQDTYLRIHGTNAPETIGTASSNGCFRMINEHVIDLYNRVEMGAPVVVL